MEWSPRMEKAASREENPYPMDRLGNPGAGDPFPGGPPVGSMAAASAMSAEEEDALDEFFEEGSSFDEDGRFGSRMRRRR
ncbi:MAG: hypothetical protein ACRDYC_05035, partial [Acidimicrobiales bacterium]